VANKFIVSLLITLSTCFSAYAHMEHDLTINTVSRVNSDFEEELPVDGICKQELGKVSVSINGSQEVVECISDSEGRGAWVSSLYVGETPEGRYTICASQGEYTPQGNRGILISTKKEILIDSVAPHIGLIKPNEISQENLSSFALGGICDQSVSNIRIILPDFYVGRFPFETSTSCNQEQHWHQGLWNIVLDLTTHTEKLKTLKEVNIVVIQTDLNGNRSVYNDKTVNHVR
jgi:hypothetical protein